MNKAIRPIAGAVIAALALSGCTSWPGAGGKVDHIRVPDAQVVHTAEAIASATGGERLQALRQSVFDLTVGEASRQVAASQHVHITEADKAAVLAGSQGAQKIIAGGGAEWGDAVATTSIVIDRLGKERFVEGLRALDIQINPRYGTWSPEQLTMVDSALAPSVESLQRTR